MRLFQKCCNICQQFSENVLGGNLSKITVNFFCIKTDHGSVSKCSESLDIVGRFKQD